MQNDNFQESGFFVHLRQLYSPVPESDEERIMEAVNELLDKTMGASQEGRSSDSN